MSVDAAPARPSPTPGLHDTLSRAYGVPIEAPLTDLGGSSNLNLLTPDGLVVRVHREWVSEERLSAIQRARASLRRASVPFPEAVPTLDGELFTRFGSWLVEAERFVPGANMEDCDGTLLTGLSILARIHDELAELPANVAAARAPAPNHVGADEALDLMLDAADSIRRWARTEYHRWIADAAVALASELPRPVLPEQLVHGDFWDNNVLFDGPRCVAVLDLDMMGVRPRIDDLALTLYYVQSTFGDGDTSDERIALLRRHVDAYDAALRVPLTRAERTALPAALARGVLAFARHVRSSDDRSWQRKVTEGYAVDLQWSLDIARDMPRWRDAFA